MSQFQPSYPSEYGCSSTECGRDVRGVDTCARKTAGRVKDARKSSPSPWKVAIGCHIHSGRSVVIELDIVNKDFIGIFSEMNAQLSQCKLSKEHEEIRELLYEDLKSIRDLIVTVLTAHRQVASTIRQVLDTPTPRGHKVPDVRRQLRPAWQSIRAVTAQISLVAERLRVRSEALKQAVESEDPAFRALCKLLYEMKRPPAVWGEETRLGLASPIWSGIHTDPKELQTLSTKIIQCLSNIGAVARFKDFVEYLGRDAPVDKHDALNATDDSLLSVKVLTKQLGQIIGSLEHTWLREHSADFAGAPKTVTSSDLLETANVLDKHIDDCMEMAGFIQRNFQTQTDLLSGVQLYEQRKWHAYGVQALRSCPKRAATLATYLEQRVSEVHQVFRSRCLIRSGTTS